MYHAEATGRITEKKKKLKEAANVFGQGFYGKEMFFCSSTSIQRFIPLCKEINFEKVETVTVKIKKRKKKDKQRRKTKRILHRKTTTCSLLMNI